MKTMLRRSCSPPRRSPIRDWSRTKVSAVRATPIAKTTAASQVWLSGSKFEDASGAISTKATPRPAPSDPVVARAALITERWPLSRRGSSPISRVPSPTVARKPSRVIAEIAALARPTESWVK